MTKTTPKSGPMDGDDAGPAGGKNAETGEQKYVPLFPRPRDIEVGLEWHHVYPDGRETLNLLTAEGRAEKERRIDIAWDVQDGDCAICGMPLKRAEATWDHIEPRGMGGGRRDDRIGNIQAVHWRCNSEKGSQRGYSRR